MRKKDDSHRQPMNPLRDGHARSGKLVRNQSKKGPSIGVSVGGMEQIIQTLKLRRRAAQGEAAQQRHGRMTGYASMIVPEQLMNDGVVVLAAAKNRRRATDEYVGDGFRTPVQQRPVPRGILQSQAEGRRAVTERESLPDHFVTQSEHGLRLELFHTGQER